MTEGELTAPFKPQFEGIDHRLSAAADELIADEICRWGYGPSAFARFVAAELDALGVEASPAERRPLAEYAARTHAITYLRDRFRCQLCDDCEPSTDLPSFSTYRSIQIDHLVPRAYFRQLGTAVAAFVEANSPTNLACSCAGCNLGKGKMDEAHAELLRGLATREARIEEVRRWMRKRSTDSGVRGRYERVMEVLRRCPDARTDARPGPPVSENG